MSGWQYLLFVNLYITLFFSFYSVFLKKETFFQLNRLYLVSCVIISFLIPFIQASWVSELSITQQVEYTIHAKAITIYANPVAEKYFTASNFLIFIYTGGSILLTVRLMMRLLALKRILALPNLAAPFSFFRKIHIGNGLSAGSAINDHETIHSHQWHSADVILMELITIINWFNPVIYFYARALKSVHEFIADEGALKSGSGKADYALLLLSQTFETPINNLVNPFFNQTLLKQRIMMIQKNRSRKTALLKYSLSAPLMILMLILTSATVNKVAGNAGESSKAANKTVVFQQKDTRVFTVVEKEPEYPGGVSKFYSFLQQNIKYPAAMREKKVQGKVFIGFIVEKDGSLSNLKVLREPGYGSGKEALRVMSLSPKWEPGIQNKKKVRVQYTIPISFTLKG